MRRTQGVACSGFFEHDKVVARAMLYGLPPMSCSKRPPDCAIQSVSASPKTGKCVAIVKFSACVASAQ